MATTETPTEKLERRKAESARDASPKKPQDHKTKKASPDTEGFVPVEYEGATIRVQADLDPATDFELLDAIGKLEEGAASGLGNLVRMITAPGDFPVLMNACRNTRGKVDPETLAGFIPVALEAGGLGNS